MTGGPYPNEIDARAGESAIDLRRLFRALMRAKRWILVPTLACFGLASIFVSVVSPRYTGVAKVLLENQETYFTRPEKASADPAPSLDTEGVQSEAEAAASPDVARQAIKAMGLAANDEFARSSWFSALMASTGLYRADAASKGDGAIVDAFLSHLLVFPIVRTRVLQIEFTSQKPELAAEGANKIAALFLENKASAKKTAAKSAAAWLAGKIDELRTKSADADQKVEAFRAQSGLLASANNLTVPTQQLSDISAQMAAARSQQTAALAKARMLRTMMHNGNLAEVPDVAKDESLRRYAEQRVTLKAQIAAESLTLLPGHPRMKELNAQLAGLDAEIRGAAAKSVRGLENEARLAASQVDSLNAALAKQSTTVASGNADEARLRALELDAKTTRDQLESYVQKYREAIARDADNASPSDARVISAASAPLTPTFPKKAPTVALASLAGFLVALSVAASRILLAGEGAASPVVNRDKAVDAPALVAKADAEATTHGVAAAIDDADIFTGPANLAGALRDRRRILIAGEASNVSLRIALAVARTMAQTSRCVFVDVSRSPEWLAGCVAGGPEGGEAVLGLSDLLSEQASFDEILHRDASSPLDIVISGAQAAAEPGLELALAALAASYDSLILHAADWRSLEAIEVMASCDSLVLTGARGHLTAAIAKLREAHADERIALFAIVEAEGQMRREHAA